MMDEAASEFDQAPVVILCGGKGVVLQAGGGRVNKGLVALAGKPLFSWVMLHYALHGAANFLLATGLQGTEFRHALVSELGAISSRKDGECYELSIAGRRCSVRLVPTEVDATTADRLIECTPWLQHDRFCLTYSDTLSDVDLSAEMRFHREAGLVATLVAAQLPVRFRVLGMRQGEPIVRAFAARPVIEAAPINGGYYIFERALLEKYMAGLAGAGIILESATLEQLATDGQLCAFAHQGAWQHFDCERDVPGLEQAAHRLASLAAGRGTNKPCFGQSGNGDE
jgi:glucose-1-phosphate cytidylyltransferase